jgi:general nucleoside transport system ATP-binding protein
MATPDSMLVVPDDGGARSTEAPSVEREVLRMEGITKRFGGMLANDAIDLGLARGEVLALLGENGAGKTTLMNILFGHYRPDAGRVLVSGQALELGSPRAAVKAGVGMVHQHFTLVEAHTALENVVVGTEPLRALRRRRSDAARRLEELSARFGLPVDLERRVCDLSVGEKQRLEILKALYGDARILVLDEPTAVLAPSEVDGLLAFLKGFAEQGNSVVFISHKLQETMSVSTRVQVLRQGRTVAVRPTAETSPAELTELMVGRPVERLVRRPRPPRQPVLQIDGLTVHAEDGRPLLQDVCLTVREHETVGVAGVAGNGQAVLADVIGGVLEPTSGTIEILGEDATGAGPRDLVARGVARVPEDRLGAGLKPDRPIWENLIVYDYRRHQRLGLFDFRGIRREATRLIEDYGVSAPGWKAETRLLSGGNLQKLVLARELSRNPRFILASQPTRGLDVGAISEVYERLIAACDAGAGMLVISEDLDEVITLSDRIVVMYEGRVAATLEARDATPQLLGHYMLGGTDSGAPR